MLRSNKGQNLLEAVASTVIILPLMVTLVFAFTEISQYFMIQAALNNAARQAARELAIDYATVVGIDTSPVLQSQYVFSTIHEGKIVNSPNQFVATFDETDIPNTVTVRVNYTSGSNGCPVFPNPDPIHLGSKLQLQASAVYRLE